MQHRTRPVKVKSAFDLQIIHRATANLKPAPGHVGKQLNMSTVYPMSTYLSTVNSGFSYLSSLRPLQSHMSTAHIFVKLIVNCTS